LVSSLLSDCSLRRNIAVLLLFYHEMLPLTDAARGGHLGSPQACGTVDKPFLLTYIDFALLRIYEKGRLS
jgi:hypothetical protein